MKFLQRCQTKWWVRKSDTTSGLTQILPDILLIDNFKKYLKYWYWYGISSDRDVCYAAVPLMFTRCCTTFYCYAFALVMALARGFFLSSHSCDTSWTLWWKFFKFDTNILWNSRMNWSDVDGQRSEVTVTVTSQQSHASARNI